MAVIFVLASSSVVVLLLGGGFTPIITVIGALGGTMVFYEVHQTKRIAQAQFIRELNSSFTSDLNISRLWEQLLLGKPITNTDRALISSYLTFFETIYILISAGVVKINFIDDLFRNRFFTAVGNHSIQEVALMRSAESFGNIHKLVAIWSDHVRKLSQGMHAGYAAYLEAQLAQMGFGTVRLGPTHLDELIALQARVLNTAEASSHLRENHRSLLLECLERHIVLGLFDGTGTLSAAGILYMPDREAESLSKYIYSQMSISPTIANLKVVLVEEVSRRKGLGKALVSLLEREAIKLGISELLCTIHPGNQPSRRLFTSLGYRRRKIVKTSYGRRAIYSRQILPASRSAAS